MLDMHISLASLSSPSSASSYCSPTTRGDGCVVPLAACGYLIMGAMGCVDPPWRRPSLFGLVALHRGAPKCTCTKIRIGFLAVCSPGLFTVTTSPSASRPTTSIHPSYLHHLSTSTSLYDLTSLLKDVLHTSVHIYPHLRTYIFLSWSVVVHTKGPYSTVYAIGFHGRPPYLHISFLPAYMNLCTVVSFFCLLVWYRVQYK
ncbi:hypothetical protein C8F04DRAFT_1114330 [Mycena alexandri]|uniref:Uncharacterized protein n=1 Tax=Mycena alexandri TaxID=1745969 RepID=A0AAD6WWP5_9AGAR|nr:hypothetical protein C8F04DRAFT_1114330 [Mycena alexandri]